MCVCVCWQSEKQRTFRLFGRRVRAIGPGACPGRINDGAAGSNRC